MRVWTLDHDELVEVARARVTRELRPDERATCLPPDWPEFGEH